MRSAPDSLSTEEAGNNIRSLSVSLAKLDEAGSISDAQNVVKFLGTSKFQETFNKASPAEQAGFKKAVSRLMFNALQNRRFGVLNKVTPDLQREATINADGSVSLVQEPITAPVRFGEGLRTAQEQRRQEVQNEINATLDVLREFNEDPVLQQLSDVQLTELLLQGRIQSKGEENTESNSSGVNQD